MGTPVSTAFIPASQALQAAVIAGLAMAAPDLASQSSHSPCSWAEASPSKCHQVLPLLKTPRVPTAQRHPITFLLLVSLQTLRPCFRTPVGGFPVIPIP